MSSFQVFAEWQAKQVHTGKTRQNTVYQHVEADFHPEILHVTQKPFDIMSVDMLGAIIPKDISICLVVQEIARQIEHFTSDS